MTSMDEEFAQPDTYTDGTPIYDSDQPGSERTGPADRPATERTALDKLWDELLMDALASDGPIRDADVKNAVKHYRARIEAEAAQGAAPRAEGLDVERLRQAMTAAWRRNEGTVVEGIPPGAARIAAEYARLSRPSDERVPESEEPR